MLYEVITNIDYPDVDQEFEILLNAQKRKVINELELINAVVTAEEVIRFQSIVHQVLVDENLLRYIASIIEKTRSSSALYLGASPRASLAVLNAAKAYAAIEGRDFVTPDDIKFVIIPVLHHRVILTPDRITSYNVCYTKLLRLKHMLPYLLHVQKEMML